MSLARPARLSRKVLPLLMESTSSLILMFALAVVSRGVHSLIWSREDEEVGGSTGTVDVRAEGGDPDGSNDGGCGFVTIVNPGNGIDIPEYGRDIPGNGKDMPGNGRDMPGCSNDMPGYAIDMPGYAIDMPDSFPKEAPCR